MEAEGTMKSQPASISKQLRISDKYHVVIPELAQIKSEARIYTVKELPVEIHGELRARFDKLIQGYPFKHSRETVRDMLVNNAADASIHKVASDHDTLFLLIWLSKAPVLEDAAGTGAKVLQKEVTDKLATNPKLKQQINEILIHAFQNAAKFYDWHDWVTRGVIVNGNDSNGMEIGKDMGLQVGVTHITRLISAIESGNPKTLKTWTEYVESSIAHEFTHRLREDKAGGFFLAFGDATGTEVVSHMIQFCYNPLGDSWFKSMLQDNLDGIEKHRTEVKERQMERYESAIYVALILVANELAKHDESFKAAIVADTDANKLNTLRQMVTGVKPEWVPVLKEFAKNLLDTGQKLGGTDYDYGTRQQQFRDTAAELKIQNSDMFW